jgi:hypothetical protein
MPSALKHSRAVTVSAIPTAGGRDSLLAVDWAEERYTAARRQYTRLYVESVEQPGADLIDDLAVARARTIELAAALRRVQDGEPEAIRRELALGPVPEDEQVQTTDRFTIAELHRAAAATPATWAWKR